MTSTKEKPLSSRGREVGLHVLFHSSKFFIKTTVDPESLSGSYGVGDDMSYTVGEQYNFPNLLQIWRVHNRSGSRADSENDGETDSGTCGGYEGNIGDRRIMMNSSRSSYRTVHDFSNTEAHLAYCIGMDRGSCWKVVWSPWNPFRAKGAEDGTCLMGVLAVVCGDGSCLVFVLPKSLSSASSGTARPSIESKDCVANNVVVIPEASVCRWVLTVPIEKGSVENISIISASWNPHDSLQLSCGLADGSVAIYNLDPELSSPPSLHSPPPLPPTLSTSIPQNIQQFLSSSMATSSHITSQSLSNASLSKKNTIDTCNIPYESRSKNAPLPCVHLRDHIHDTNNFDQSNYQNDLENHLKRHENNRNRCVSNDLFSIEKRTLNNGSAVRSVSYCPLHPQLLLSAGYGSDIKVNLHNLI